jgi:hypothetical protein
MAKVESLLTAEQLHRTTGAKYECRLTDDELHLIVPLVLEELCRATKCGPSEAETPFGSMETLQVLDAWVEIGGNLHEIFDLLVHGNREFHNDRS